MTDPTGRFTSRVANYIRYRPGYPQAVAELLIRTGGLAAGAQVADIGSGTGILAELLLRNGLRVWGVEPNAAMREAGERLLAGYPEFRSVAGSAEATTLPAASVDLITAGQAFHWFEREPARAEWLRILRPGGLAALIWNERRMDSPFLIDYDLLLRRHSADYLQVRHTDVDDAAIGAFFGGPWTLAGLPNEQRFDYAGLEGRLLSSSYAPEAGQPGHEPLLAGLREIFEHHQRGGQVAFTYETRIYYGPLRSEHA